MKWREGQIAGVADFFPVHKVTTANPLMAKSLKNNEKTLSLRLSGH
jgi:hypothetical protein